MLDTLKPLIVVLVLSFAVFKVAQPICLRFMDVRDFSRRRNVWLALTALEFLIPNFWIFSGLAFVIIYWAGSVDRHPTALYALLMICVPPGDLLIPMPFINQLFALSFFRVIALALVIPACFRLARTGGAWPKGAALVDWVLLAYGLLQLLLYAEFESPTNTLRRAVLFGMDVYALYFMFSRGAGNRQAMRDTLACFWLTAGLQVPIAAFESVKGWLLYTNIGDRWGMPNVFAWLMRGDALRAQGAAGHSLTMGFVFALAFGVWLYLGRQIQSKRMPLLIGGAMWVGLIATYARAPWIVAVFVFLVFTLFAPGGKAKVFRTLAGGAVVLAVLAATPFGGKILSILPFVGTADQDNVDYRQRLATVSWQLIKEHPWFGNPFALSQMEDLRQGQGIIDLVNTFATIALFYGGVGATLFTTCLVYPLVRTFIAVRSKAMADADVAGMGALLVSGMLGIMLMLTTCSLLSVLEMSAWMFAGLCSAFPLLIANEGRKAPSLAGRPVSRSAYT